jgi:hypothetical protein
MVFNICSNASWNHPSPWRRDAIGLRTLFGYASSAVGALMNIKLARIVGLIAGALVLAADGRALDRAATPAVQAVAVKKPAPKRAGRPSKEDSDPMAAVPVFSAEAVGWQFVEDPKTGARLGVPEKLVPHLSASRAGSRWASTQGQIQVETFRLTEASLPALFEDEKKSAHRRVASSVLKPDSFSIAGVQGLKNFLVHAEARGGEVRGVTILYDQATEGTMSHVAVAIVKAFAGFPDPNAALPPGLRRMVEYGSGIVVSDDGDLVAPARVVDQCQAITVPPFGHAERIAEDKANNLALLRLYGARNLVPAALAGDNAQPGDVTLVGVADPLGQGSDATPISAAARLTAQGVEPAPKPGFSGAAAVDANSRVAGMVDLKPAAVAGTGAASQAAALVPINAIRTFLQAQHIVPAAAANAAVNLSVVRVICVRK